MKLEEDLECQVEKSRKGSASTRKRGICSLWFFASWPRVPGFVGRKPRNQKAGLMEARNKTASALERRDVLHSLPTQACQSKTSKWPLGPLPQVQMSQCQALDPAFGCLGWGSL